MPPVHDYVIANGTGAAVRSDLNDALAAIVSNNSSSTEPATTYAYQWWADTNANVLKIRNSANNAWITLRELDGTMLIEDGSASTPGLAFADDVNTGIFSPAADQIGFATGGAERLEIGSSEVVFNDPSNDVDFRVESNGNTHMLFVDAGNDRVGIGTSSADALLHLKDNSPFIRFTDSADDTHYAHIGYSDSSVWLIDADAGNAKANSAIQFKVDNSERMRVNSSGNLNIGVSTPGNNNAAKVFVNNIDSSEHVLVLSKGDFSSSQAFYYEAKGKYVSRNTSDVNIDLVQAIDAFNNIHTVVTFEFLVASAINDKAAKITGHAGFHRAGGGNFTYYTSTPSITMLNGSGIGAGSLSWVGSGNTKTLRYTTNSNSSYLKYVITDLKAVGHDYATVNIL